MMNIHFNAKIVVEIVFHLFQHLFTIKLFRTRLLRFSCGDNIRITQNNEHDSYKILTSYQINQKRL